jgi:hypothetical protein
MELHDYEVEDVAGATLSLLGRLIESYIRDGYCDPTMFRALEASEVLAHRLGELATENGKHDVFEGVQELLVNIRLTAMEAGEVIGSLIEENGFPIDPRTFELLDQDGERD